MLPYPILELGDIKIYMYGLMIATGILVCFFTLFHFGKKLGMSNKYIDYSFYVGLLSIVVGFIGSAAWQGLFNYIDDVKNGVENPVFSLNGGITAVGGLVCGVLCFIIFALLLRKKAPFLTTKVAIVAPCCMAVAHAFGRVGCLMAGCCHGAYLGKEYVFGGIYMNGTTDGWGYYVPVQLYEALVLFALFGTLLYLAVKKKFRYTFIAYMVVYSVWRFFIEFARADYRGSFVTGLSPSQFQSLALLVVAIPGIFLFRYFFKKMDAAEKASAVAQAAVAQGVSEQPVAEVSCDMQSEPVVQGEQADISEAEGFNAEGADTKVGLSEKDESKPE